MVLPEAHPPPIAARYLASPHQRGGDPLGQCHPSRPVHPLLLWGPEREVLPGLLRQQGQASWVCAPLSEGTPNANEISLRKITTEALALNATVVVLAHNHPSGLATPSQEGHLLHPVHPQRPAPPGHHPCTTTSSSPTTTWSPCGTAVTSRPFDRRRTKRHAPPTGGHRLLQIGRFLCPNFKSSATTPPPATSRKPSKAWPGGWSWGWTNRPFWGSPAPARPSPWPRSSKRSSGPLWCPGPQQDPGGPAVRGV